MYNLRSKCPDIIYIVTKFIERCIEIGGVRNKQFCYSVTAYFKKELGKK
jgi:hypothetical protein